MYSASPAFNTAIHQPGRTMRSQLAVAGAATLDDAVIQSMEFKRGVTPDTGLQLGTAIAQQLTVKLLNPDGNYSPADFTGKELTPSIGAQLADESFEYVPVGIFVADQPTRAESVLTIVAYDRMVQAEKPYISVLTYPSTVGAVVAEAASQCGLTLVATSWLNSTLTVPAAIEGATCRQIFGFAAECAAGFARINRAGDLEIISLAAADALEALTPANYFPPMAVADAAWAADGVVVKTTAEDVGETHGSSPARPWPIVGNPFLVGFPGAAIDAIVTALAGVEIWPFSADWQGNPALDPGDCISVQDAKTGTVRLSIAGTETLSYTGGLRSTLALVAPSAQQQATDTQISAGQQGGILSRAYTLIKRTIDSISLLVSDLGDRMSTAEIAIQPDNIKLAVGQVGGANLLRNSSFRRTPTADCFYGSPSFSVSVLDNDMSSLRVFQNASAAFGYITEGPGALYAGQTYTMILEIWGSITDKLALDYLYIMSAEHGNVLLPDAPVDLNSGAHTQLRFTITPTMDYADARILIGVRQTTINTSNSIRMRRVGLYQGDVVTAWTPNPNELKNSSIELYDDQIKMRTRQFLLELLNSSGEVTFSIDANSGALTTTGPNGMMQIASNAILGKLIEDGFWVTSLSNWGLYLRNRFTKVASDGFTITGETGSEDGVRATLKPPFSYLSFGTNEEPNLLQMRHAADSANEVLNAWGNLHMHGKNIVRVGAVTDWYGNSYPAQEKGTFTPSFEDSHLNVAGTSLAQGVYTVTGNEVELTGSITVTSLAGLFAADQIRIGGFPFAAGGYASGSNFSIDANIEFISGLTWPSGAKAIFGWVTNTATYATLNYPQSASSYASLLVSSMAPGGIRFRIKYRKST